MQFLLKLKMTVCHLFMFCKYICNDDAHLKYRNLKLIKCNNY